jgi:hypothetical protein
MAEAVHGSCVYENEAMREMENIENQLQKARKSLVRYGQEPRLLLAEFRPVYKILKTHVAREHRGQLQKYLLETISGYLRGIVPEIEVVPGPWLFCSYCIRCQNYEIAEIDLCRKVLKNYCCLVKEGIKGNLERAVSDRDLLVNQLANISARLEKPALGCSLWSPKNLLTFVLFHKKVERTRKLMADRLATMKDRLKAAEEEVSGAAGAYQRYLQIKPEIDRVYAVLQSHFVEELGYWEEKLS